MLFWTGRVRIMSTVPLLPPAQLHESDTCDRTSQNIQHLGRLREELSSAGGLQLVDRDLRPDTPADGAFLRQ